MNDIRVQAEFLLLFLPITHVVFCLGSLHLLNSSQKNTDFHHKKGVPSSTGFLRVPNIREHMASSVFEKVSLLD